MTISVTELKSRLLEIIREVEGKGHVVDIERYGRVVARLVPSHQKEGNPLERLRGSGTLQGRPEESVLEDSDFEALR